MVLFKMLIPLVKMLTVTGLGMAVLNLLILFIVLIRLFGEL